MFIDVIIIICHHKFNNDLLKRCVYVNNLIRARNLICLFMNSFKLYINHYIKENLLIKKILINRRIYDFIVLRRIVTDNVHDLYKFSSISGLPFSIRVQVCRGRDNIVLQIGSNALNRSDRTCEEIDSVVYSRGRSTKLQHCSRSKKCMIEV